MTKAKKAEGSPVGCFFLFVFVVCSGGYWLWEQASAAGWVWHDKLTIVTAKNWTTGEYKTCSEAIVSGMKEEPQIECLNFADEREPKLFKVRFYGPTYREDLKDKASFSWRCKKNEGTDSAFTCDDQKIVKWDGTK
jgi:hypothetical protein